MKTPLRVAILHYHLRRGGVTQVIESQCAALVQRGVQVALITGEPPPPECPAPAACVEGLGYGSESMRPDARMLSRAVRDAARRLIGETPDIWHVHNHHLGKNLALPVLVGAWARGGERMLLQIHDFPEDGRPANYRVLHEGLGAAERLDACYPAAPQVHYAVLNNRDRRILLGAGLAAESVHLLPNAVRLPDAGGPRPPWPADLPQGPLYLYPTRAIRRKNIGEFLLWAALAEPNAWYGVTLAPENPAARPPYLRWRELARRLNLPVRFELGLRPDLRLDVLLRRACVAATTSLAEGFGLGFLEPWLAPCPVTGRDLPDITVDFKEAGVNLSHLYTRVAIPLRWIDESALREKIGAELRRVRSAYGRPCPDADVEAAYRAGIQAETVDFGCLDEELQETVIERVVRSPADRAALIERGAFGRPPDGAASTNLNAERIQAGYGPEPCAARLASLYDRVLLDRPGDVAVHPERVLDEFLAPERFRLLRT